MGSGNETKFADGEEGGGAVGYITKHINNVFSTILMILTCMNKCIHVGDESIQCHNYSWHIDCEYNISK